jgi:hypothetical protein
VKYIDEIVFGPMAKHKTEGTGQQVRAAEQAFNDAAKMAKQLKAKSRDAKRTLKQAKKTAKKASKAARVARKAAEKARRRYQDAIARAAKRRKKAAKARQAIVTPKKHASDVDGDSQERVGHRRRGRRHAWDIGERGDAARATS